MAIFTTGTMVSRLTVRSGGIARALLVALTLVVAACGKTLDKPAHTLTVVFPPGSGFSGAGYDDTVLKAVCESQAGSPEMEVKFLHPRTLADAREQLSDWMSSPQEDKALILCGPAYESILDGVHLDSGRILLLDSVKSFDAPGVATLQLKRYGGAYLAGAVCSSFRNLILIKAFDGDRMMDTVAQGILDGYKEQGEGEATTMVLAHDYSGANMPDELFTKLYDAVSAGIPINNASLLAPVCGASRIGAYAFSNNYYSSSLGIGEDCSAFSDLLPLSLVYDLGGIVKDYIGRWLRAETWPVHEDFGLSTGHAYLKYNPRYFEIAGTRMFYRTSPCLFSMEEYRAWEEQYMPIALEKEVSHAY